MFTIISIIFAVLVFTSYSQWRRGWLYNYDPKTKRYLFNKSVHWSVRFLFDYYGTQAVTVTSVFFVAAGWLVDTAGAWYAFALPLVMSSLVLYWLIRMRRKYLLGVE
jgi:hypothetical protein